MAIAITVEPESDGVPASFFRLLVIGGVVATGLTFSQTHFAVSEVLLRIAFPDAADAGGRPFAKSEHRRGASSIAARRDTSIGVDRGVSFSALGLLPRREWIGAEVKGGANRLGAPTEVRIAVRCL